MFGAETDSNERLGCFEPSKLQFSYMSVIGSAEKKSDRARQKLVMLLKEGSSIFIF